MSVVMVEPTVSIKVTEPVGIVDVCVRSDTVAVNVAVCPLTRVAGLIVAAVAVVSPALNDVPLTETCWVLPATLSTLSVTVMPALKLPTDCGVKVTDTSQRVPAKSKMDEVHGLVSPELLEKSAV